MTFIEGRLPGNIDFKYLSRSRLTSRPLKEDGNEVNFDRNVEGDYRRADVGRDDRGPEG